MLGESNVVYSGYFSNSVTLESMYQIYLNELYENLSQKNTCSIQDVEIIKAVFSTMTIAFKAARKEDTVTVILEAAKALNKDWRQFESQLINVYQHLDQ